MAFTIRRGTNISHWLSQSQSRETERLAFFTETDVKRIAEMGGGRFDHIRLPIDEEQMWDKSGDKDSEAFELLDSALDWCEDAGLRVVVDLHILRTHHFLDEQDPPLYTDPEEEVRFVGLWRQLSDHLDWRSTDLVAYELLNEAVARNPEDWNRVAMAGYQAIREREPERTIVLGSNWYNQHQTFRQLRVPEDDDTILTFHYYLPMFVTHYTASWWATGGSYTGPIHYPGKPIARRDLKALDKEFRQEIEAHGWNRSFTRSTILEDLEQPLAVREERGLPLYCGEFGCFDHTPDPLRRAWYRDILSVFDEHNIAWANWDYKGSFGVVDQDGEPTTVAEALLSKR
jgi:endoglucanase